MTTVADVIARRGQSTTGYNPHRFVELFGGTVVEAINYEPDPQTYRQEYYYNSRVNQLFKKLKISGDTDFYYWKSINF